MVSEIDKGLEKDLKMDKKQVFFQSFQRTAMDYVKNVKRGENSLSSDELETLKILSKKKDLVIAKADKGNAVVVQDKDEYINKMVEVLSDKSKFECIPDDPTIEREAKLQRSLLSLNKAGNLPTHIYNKIRPTGSRIGTLYGLRKVHKGINPPPAGRPIISAIGTYTYDTAKYLVSILKPLRDEAKYSLKDTFDLCSRLKKANEEDELKHCQMVSYDIVSLFTNVPINETIDIILEKAFSIKHRSVVKRTRTVFDRVEVKRKGRKGPNYRPTYELVPREITESVEQFNGLEKHQLKKLLVICTQKSHFQFKGNFFDQIDGVAMGSPLGPTFAEMFMAYFEEKYMELIKEHGVVLWLRFVDDILLFFKDISKSTELLANLNNKHPNIKFTEERETLAESESYELPFLDVLVTRNVDNGIQTDVYRKKTFTGTYLHWTSLSPRDYKIGLINCLLDRAYRICSTEQALKKEVVKVKQILYKNEYPPKIVTNTVQKFFDSKKSPKTKRDNSYDVPKKKVFLVLPYYKGADNAKKEIVNLVQSSFPQVDFRFAFKSHSTISRNFSFKDSVDKDMKSKIVYRINCLDCEKFYVGKTKRQFIQRKIEHKLLDNSSVHKHMTEENHRIDWDDMQVIDTARDDRRLLLKEMLHINNLKPQLNVQKSSKLFSLLIGSRDKET
jgi:hypothetical protein